MVVVLVEIFYEVHCGPCGIYSVLVLQRGKVRVVKDRQQLVLEGRINGPVLFVQPSMLCIFLE